MADNYVIEVTTGTFRRDVIRKSRSVPVVVDFWAAWCSPCLMLGPILEKVVGEYAGRVVLAKVDVDAYPELAQRYDVRSIPAVKVFVDGEIAAEFTGSMPESQVREFLRQVVPSGADELVRQAQELKEKGRLKEAESLARKVVSEVPGHQGALEILAIAAMAGGRVEEALDLVNRMESPSKEMQFLVDGAEFWRMCAKVAAEGKTFEVPPQDTEGKIGYASCLAVKGEFVQALDLLLEIVGTDKAFREGLARKAMVSIFVVMGLTNPVVREYQSRLAQLLF